MWYLLYIYHYQIDKSIIQGTTMEPRYNYSAEDHRHHPALRFLMRINWKLKDVQHEL